ncbi:hypothetical protein PPROV_000804100 [Pycnococcus provasolii]|uniref:TOG domain-containing protein n=1 Tax=Pycnococcus provasolii TaxID=41880 RepID=A0A830HQ79_9CHLO|nr:hypothetical protein PPROV_000804100 [Pycnococcus provasolii]
MSSSPGLDPLTGAPIPPPPPLPDITPLLDINNSAIFEQLVEKLMSASNEERKHAELCLEEMKRLGPEVAALHLIQTMRKGSKVELRSMCAVLVRRQLCKDSKESLLSKISPQAVAIVKQECLNAMKEEEEKSVAHKVTDTVSELAATLLGETGNPSSWPELLPFMFQCVQSDAAVRHQESALTIFAHLAGVMSDALRPYLGTLHGILQVSLRSETLEVRTAALRASASFILSAGDKERSGFQSLLPDMLSTLETALNKQDESAAQDALEMFIEIAEMDPRFLRGMLVQMANAMTTLARTEQLESATRQLAMEFLVTLAESRDKAPGMIRKLPDFVNNLFQSLLLFLLDIDDDAEWYDVSGSNADGSAGGNEDAGHGETYDVGQEGFDRVALALGGAQVLPIASGLLPHLLADKSDWKKRHACMICLAQIAEGCAKVMAPQCDGCVDMCLTASVDEHPRVRWACFQALGQLSTDLAPDLQRKQHHRVVPCLLQAMNDVQNPRVQAHASAAIVNFSEGCVDNVLAPYLDEIVMKLLVLLEKSSVSAVQEAALTALASVADSAQESFLRHYERCIVPLKQILYNATDKQYRMLRAKAMECVSLVGMAVGKDQFRQDGDEVMQFLANLQGTIVDADDPTSQYLLQAWARFCKCLGTEFLPYLPVTMPPLLKTAKLAPDGPDGFFKVVEADDGGDDEDEEGIELFDLGDKRVSIRTSVLEEKATACNMLCCYADELKEGFFPYVEDVCTIMIPLLQFYFHEDVRKAAVQCIPELLVCVKKAVELKTTPGADATYLQNFFGLVMDKLLEVCPKEPEVEILVCVLESIQEVLMECSNLCRPDHMQKLLATFKEVADASVKRQNDRKTTKETSEDYDPSIDGDDEALEAESELEYEIWSQIAECMSSLLKEYREHVVPMVEHLNPYLLPMLLEVERQPDERRVAISIFDDVVEHAGVSGGANSLLPQYMPRVLQCCLDPDEDVRQVAVYGVGMCFAHLLHPAAAPLARQAFGPYVENSLAAIQHSISSPDAGQPKFMSATENAISALNRYLAVTTPSPANSESASGDASYASVDAGTKANHAQLYPLWLSRLPLTHDRVEARQCHDRLVWACTPNSGCPSEVVTYLLGGNASPGQHDSQRVAHVMKVLAVAMSYGSGELISATHFEGAKTLLVAFAKVLPPDVLQATHASLSDEKAQKVLVDAAQA